MPVISVIIPALNEAQGIQQCLQPLQVWRRRGHQIIVVDGGSVDGTLPLARPYADRVISCEAGRARQMNHGTSQASGDILLFLHADTLLPENADKLILDHIYTRPGISTNRWGHFSVALKGSHWLFRIIERLINWRSRLTGIASGDQAIFISRELFNWVGGFDELPLMEDIALCKKVKSHSRPLYLQASAITSSRRWEQDGIIKTVLLMWALRLGYYFGISPQRLARLYR